MFRKKWRNAKAKPALEFVSGAAASVVVGVAVLNPIDAYFNMSVFGDLGWREYAFYGVCGILGRYLWSKNRKS